jgi:acyl-CoA synthetase (AMP-forming)/AMP-acid ligase II
MTSAAHANAHALSSYLPAFAPELQKNHFLTYYSIQPDKSFIVNRYTRGEFLILAARAKQILITRGINSGDHVCHYFSSNSVADLAFRFASIFVGCIPVTVNWSADTAERILYKIQITNCKLVLRDDNTDPTILTYLEDQVSSTQQVSSIINASKCLVASSLADQTIGGDGGTILAAMLLAEQNDVTLPLASTRIIIFTSGTTGKPKGVKLSYSNYETNRATFEQFLEIEQDSTITLTAVVVNPLHHTNSTSITDWALRRPGACLHLFQRYTTPYWGILAQLGHTEKTLQGIHRLVAPAVSRHFDYLESLAEKGALPNSESWIKNGLNRVNFLIGSAPVGPSTVACLQRFAGKLPLVRFGSTETCLQVMGTPRRLSEAERLVSFQRGWNHVNPQNITETQPGYYIGQQHPPHTQVMIVESTAPEDGDAFMRPRDEGVPGYIVTRGGHVMTGYVDNQEATIKALVPSVDGSKKPWYVNLGDVGFWMKNLTDGQQDIYWMSRDSALLIRGGSNYAYEQINQELKSFLVEKMGMNEHTTAVAVVGLKLNSEHEDDCCVTIEVINNNVEPFNNLNELSQQFMILACAKGTGAVSKGAQPSYVRFGSIPKNFKGAILVKDLKKDWQAEIATRKNN